MLNFREIELTDAHMLLEWRLKPRINNLMLSEIKNDLKQQYAWIEGMRANPASYHWIAQINGMDAGYFKINNMTENSAEEGGYIGLDNYIMYHGPILREFIHAIFSRFGFAYLNSSVVEGNRILKIMDFLGYALDPDRKNDIKPGKDNMQVFHFVLPRGEFFSRHKKLENSPAAALSMEKWQFRELYMQEK